jgi:HAD superfamily hydrolase (TIGR01509 family)
MVDWKRIETVLLDMDGTLLDLSFDDYLWNDYLPLAYAQHHNVDPIEARRDLSQRFAANQGTLEWYCLDFWTRELQLDVAALERQIADRIQLRPHAEEFLQALVKTDKHRLLTTNAHPKSMSLKMKRSGLEIHFNAIVSSHQFGQPKESQEFWVALQSTYGFDPATTLLIDDNLAVLAAAQRFGIVELRAVHQPSSRSPPVSTGSFTGISSFREIWPGDNGDNPD